MKLQRVDHDKFKDYLSSVYAGTYFCKASWDYVAIAETDKNELVVAELNLIDKIVKLGGKVTPSGFEVSNYEDTIPLARTKETHSTDNFISYKDMYHLVRLVNKTELLMTYNRIKDTQPSLVNVSFENNKISIVATPEDTVKNIDMLRQARTARFNVRVRNIKSKDGAKALLDKDIILTAKAVEIVNERSEVFKRERAEANKQLESKIAEELKKVNKGLDQRHKKLVVKYIGTDTSKAEPNTWAIHTLILHKKATGQTCELKYVIARLDLANVKNVNELKRVINGRESIEAMILNGENIANIQYMAGRNVRGKSLAGKRQYSVDQKDSGKESKAATSKGYTIMDTDLINMVYV